MSYSRGLGITTSGSNTILAQGAEVHALQRQLVARGEIPASYADGRISSGTSPTLRAVQTNATAMGLPTSAVVRTSGMGLQLPTALYQAIMQGTDAAIAEAARTGTETPSEPWVSEVVKQITGRDKPTTDGGSNFSPVFIWLATGTAVVMVGAFALYASSRARRGAMRKKLGDAGASTVRMNRRRRRRS